MTVPASLALAAGLLAYTAASSAFVGYRLGPMVKSWARPPGRAFVLRTKLLRILACGFNLSRKDGAAR